MLHTIRQIKTKKLTWIQLSESDEGNIEYLRDTYEFHPLDLEDCLNHTQRPKVDVYENYIFLVLLFPRYDRSDRKIVPSEIDFFIGPDYLISISGEKNGMVDHFFDECLKSEVLRERYLSDSPAYLLYELLHRLQAGIFPMIDHMTTDIDALQGRIYTGAEKRMVKEILLTKRNIVNFRRIVNAHKTTLRKLINTRSRNVFVLTADLAVYYGNLIDRTKDIWDLLEIHRETLSAYQEANDSMITYKINDAIKILTAISVSILPATLLAAIFGMNTINMPIISRPYGFWILVGTMVIFITSLMAYFKRNDWL